MNILASQPRGTLYIGVTTNVPKRVALHRAGNVPDMSANGQEKAERTVRSRAMRAGAFAAAAAMLVGASVLAAASPRGHFKAPSSTHIQDELRRIHLEAASLPQRVEAVSALFLGAPYKLGALGEGPGGAFDRDPLIRFDAFDCTTFVETVMALALDSDLDAATRTLQQIRYHDGQIGYATRNHFIEADWVPNNVRAGYLRDITADVAGRNAVTVHKTISKRKWYGRKSPASIEGNFTREERQQLVSKLRQLGERLPDARATLTVLPIKALPQALAHIPSGTIANLVHADRRDRGTLVSHQVLLIKKSDGWYLRHAALGKGVEDDPIGRLGRYRDLRWRLVGLNLDVLHDPKSRPMSGATH